MRVLCCLDGTNLDQLREAVHKLLRADESNVIGLLAVYSIWYTTRASSMWVSIMTQRSLHTQIYKMTLQPPGQYEPLVISSF
jgi:hypothetical protein